MRCILTRTEPLEWHHFLLVPIEPLVPIDHWNCPVPSQATWENNLSPLYEMHINQQNHWNDLIFYWYQSYHWYQWTRFLSLLMPMESICEHWTTLHSHGLYLSSIGSNLFYFKNVSALASLHCRCNLTPVSNVCKAVVISLFSALNGLNKLLEMLFKFPFNLINKLTMVLLTSQQWCILKSWYTGRGPEQGFLHCFADRLNQKLSSFCGAGYRTLLV